MDVDMEVDYAQDLETDEAPAVHHNETSVIPPAYVPTGYGSKDTSLETIKLILQPQSEEQCVYRPCLNSPKNSYSTVVGGNNTRTSVTSNLSARHYVPEFPETLVNNNVATRINSNNSESREQSTSSSNPCSVNEEKLDINNCGVSFDRPKHPNFAIPVARLNTLKNWPKNYLVTPEELCEAGFFYSGREDTTVCFYCNQGLNAWEAGDRPWTEHARWSPHCTHVLNIKGPEFVRQVLKFANDPEKLKEIDNTYKQKESAQAEAKPRSNHRLETDSCSSEENPVDNLFGGPAAQSVITVIKNKELVKSAIRYVVKKEGTSYSFTAVELMEVVLDIKEGKIKIPGKSSKANKPVNQGDLYTDCEDLDSCSSEENPVDNLFGGPAAQSVITVIKNKELVKSAIRYVVKKEGTSYSFTAVELMEVVLDIKEGKIKIPGKSSKANKPVNQGDLYTDCEDLEYGAKAILTKNRSLKEQMRCKVCLDQKVCIVFLPCGHLCTCAECAPALRDCPVCRKFVRGTVKTYMA